MPNLRLLRSLARSPGFSLAVAGMLAIGTAALATTFALADAAILRQPPFERAEDLVLLSTTRTNATGEARQERFSWPRVRLVSEQARSFETISNHATTTLTLIGPTGATSATGEIVGTSYFRMLRAKPIAGRFFLPDEDEAEGAHPVVVLSHDLWRDFFQGDTQTIGGTIRANGVTLTIVGIAEPGFRGLSGRALFWIPTTMAPATSYPEYLTTNQNFISIAARLKANVSIQQARAELAVLGPRINTEAPSSQQGRIEPMSATATSINEMRSEPSTRRSVLALL
ncbi:MAG: ABC transporter permease, partial [bacterium]